MLKGLLMRRQSSQASASSVPDEDTLISPVSAGGGQSPTMEPFGSGPEPIFGDPSVDAGNEVRFSVEVTQLYGLQDTLSVDVRRMKGDLRSYQFLYNTIME
jgi:protein-serine/threonine kinase